MKILLIGAGNVATCIADAIRNAGHKIVGVYSRTEENARALAESLCTVYSCNLSELPEADVCLTMLRDDALLEHASTIVRCNPDAIHLHTSGSVPMSVWQDAGSRHCGVLYPMQTFSKGKRIDWRNVPFFVEASSDDCLACVKALASSLSDSVTELDSRQRCRMHLAAVFACNFSNRMFAISEAILKECGIPFSVMKPLIEETCGKALVMSPKDAQTGPAVRGDDRVMSVHRNLLMSDPEWQELYRMISDDIINAYK